MSRRNIELSEKTSIVPGARVRQTVYRGMTPDVMLLELTKTEMAARRLRTDPDTKPLPPRIRKLLART